MITLYTWKTPNGCKPAIMLEEVGLPYTVRTVDIGADEQFDPAFLAVSPNNKIPAIVDDDAEGSDQAVFESGAILTYLAVKSGRLLPSAGPEHWSTLQWLHWSIGGLGPMLGQLNFFAVRSDQKAPLAIERFIKEGRRLLSVLEKRLATTPYVAGDAYSIADIVSYPWMHTAKTAMSSVLGDTFVESPGINDWMARLEARPAVAKGMKVLES